MNKKGYSVLTSALVIQILSLSGCGGFTRSGAPVLGHEAEGGAALSSIYDTHFADFEVSTVDEMKGASFERTYSGSYDDIWGAVLDILTQHGIIAHVSYDCGAVTYVDIDGLLLGDRYVYREFPFTLMIEKADDGADHKVSVHPMAELLEGKFPEQELAVLRTGLITKAEQFLERLSVQLTSRKRWPWLAK